MKSLKVKLGLIVALALTMFIALGVFLGNIALANRNVTLSGASIFVTSGSADVWAHRVFVGEGEEEEEEEFKSENPDYAYYTMFTFAKDEDTVSYRRNLAYHWYYNKGDVDDYSEPYEGENGHWWIRGIDTGIEYNKDDERKVENGVWVIGENVTEIGQNDPSEMGEGYLTMEIGFEEVNFEKYIIAFESQQYNMTKDEKTTNYIVFVKAEDENDVQKVYAVITDDKDIAEAKKEDIDVTDLVKLDIDHIVIQLDEMTDGDKGDFKVTVSNNNNDENIQEGVFKNVGGMYAKYVSSTTKPVTPLTFKAEFEEDEDGKQLEGQTRARMALYELNNQSFILNRGADGEVINTQRAITRDKNVDGTYRYGGGQVNDTQPPVLCLDSGVTYVRHSSELSFSYTAVDVLSQSPTAATAYFMLTNEQVQKALDGEFNPNDFESDVFETVTGDNDVYIYPHTNHYVPVEGEDYNANGYGTAFKKNENSDDKAAEFIPTSAVKISLKLTDTKSTGGQSTYVFLDWFVEKEYKLHIGDYDYIAVATDEVGASFSYVNYEDGTESEEWKTILAEYQQRVDDAAKDLRAGSGEDFYLPSLETLLSDNATAYEDLTFSIYYMVNGTTSSNTGRKSSQLYINLNAAGDYIFTVYATDNASNDMWYVDGDGKVQKFPSNEIWDMYDGEDEDNQLKNMLPWFKFSAGISEISVEEPEEQSTAYVGTSYTASAFTVKGLSTQSTYTLYLFNQDLYAADHNGQVLSYQQFMQDKKILFEENRNYFTNIVAQSQLDANSEEYEQFNAYAWNPSSRTFIPQDVNAFYLIKCEVTSTQFPTQGAVTEYMGIAASATPEAIKGENTWAQDNMTSIILLSIAGAAFLGIILLIFIKPKNKGDIDVQFEEEVEKGKKAKAKK